MNISNTFKTASEAEQVLTKLDIFVPVFTRYELEAMEIADRLGTLVREFDEAVTQVLADARKLSAKIGLDTSAPSATDA
jgi:hypothetical protein